MPVIVSNIGALPEIVSQGVDGLLCNNEEQFLQAIEEIDRVNPLPTYEQFKAKYSIENVVAANMKVYEDVANGLRWAAEW